jgi:hypothetical protein
MVSEIHTPATATEWGAIVQSLIEPNAQLFDEQEAH